jgi:CTP:molybdopterin cytidylyltransferase MocA
LTTESPKVAGILLAAGDGSRLGQPKALVVVGGQSLVRRGIVLLQAGGAAPVIVVTGAATLDEADLGDPGVTSVHNPRWQSGMGSSLAVGLAAVPVDCTAAVLALADQPLVGPEAVRRLIAAHVAGASLAVACYSGQPRNPVLISREHWAVVADMATGDTGARPFMRAHPDLVTSVECADTGRPDDIDTREDLARIAALLGSPPFAPGQPS